MLMAWLPLRTATATVLSSQHRVHTAASVLVQHCSNASHQKAAPAAYKQPRTPACSP
jgi:hypothetical protein